MRRPTSIRLYSHSWEWSGYLNYTKGLPVYQGELSQANKFTYFFTNSTGGRVYATGFSEEGFAVTPQGYTDIATGDIIAVDQIGNDGANIDIPTSFDQLVVGDLEVKRLLNLGTSNVNGTVDWSGSLRIDAAEVNTLNVTSRIQARSLQPIQYTNPDLYKNNLLSIYGNLGVNDPNTGTNYTKIVSTSSYARYNVEISMFSGAVSTDPYYIKYIIHQRAAVSGAYEVTFETIIDPRDLMGRNLVTATLTDNNTGPDAERTYTFTVNHQAVGASRNYSVMNIIRTG